MRVLFVTTHTLYLKVCIPLMRALRKEGVEVHVAANIPNMFGYSPGRYADRPIHNTCVNKAAYRYVSGLIECDEDDSADGNDIRWELFPLGRYDVVIGTIKDLRVLQRYVRKGGPRVFALGYQHIPVLLSLTGQVRTMEENARCRRVFLDENQFSLQHRFTDIITGQEVVGHAFVNFLYLDGVYRRYGRDAETAARKHVLIFHPGGGRGIISEPGIGRIQAWKLQLDFLKAMCGPILAANKIPVVKVHPLPARHHALGDLLTLKEQLVREDTRFSDMIVTDDPYWPYALNSRLIVTFGSSAVYELFAAGIHNVVICSFYGKARSSKFSFFEDMTVDSHEEYARRCSCSPVAESQERTLSDEVFSAYASLFTGNATESVMREVMS